MTDLIHAFPGYEYIKFGEDNKPHNMFKGQDVGFGGLVRAKPGYYQNVALLDVASMHPASITAMNHFGPYTKTFNDIVAARVAIKRKDFTTARQMLDGKLAPFLEDENSAEMLSYALKIAANSCYGLTSAGFPNPFKDPRNVNNIVALRGALFMATLQEEVEKQGSEVVHIKTDSLKIPNATPEIIDFVFEFGKKYGYEFEHEATYDEFALFNDAVYIAHDHKGWHATGAQFQHPYVFKRILSKDPLEFDDFCETKNVVRGSIFIATENDRKFVGRIGRFVPIQPGQGGGTLLRVNEVNGEMRDYAVTGTKGYEWLEAELVKGTEYEDKIDMSYFEALENKAREALVAVGYEGDL